MDSAWGVVDDWLVGQFESGWKQALGSSGHARAPIRPSDTRRTVDASSHLVAKA